MFIVTLFTLPRKCKQRYDFLQLAYPLLRKVTGFWKRHLAKFNTKFSVLPQKKRDLHRALTEIDKENLDKIFSEQNTRIVNNDFTIKLKGKWYQLAERQPTLVLRKDKVLIEERIDSSIFISLRNKYLDYTVLPERPKKMNMKVLALTKKKSSWKPPADHPWRRFSLSPKTKVEKTVLIKSFKYEISIWLACMKFLNGFDSVNNDRISYTDINMYLVLRIVFASI